MTDPPCSSACRSVFHAIGDVSQWLHHRHVHKGAAVGACRRDWTLLAGQRGLRRRYWAEGTGRLTWKLPGQTLSWKAAGVTGGLAGQRLSRKAPGTLPGDPARCLPRKAARVTAQPGGLTRDTAGQPTRDSARKPTRDAAESAEPAGQAARKAPAATERAGGGHQQVTSAGDDVVHQPAPRAEQRVGDVHRAAGAPRQTGNRVVGGKWLLGSGRGGTGAKPDRGDCCQRHPESGCHSGEWPASCRMRKPVVGQRNTPQIWLFHSITFRHSRHFGHSACQMSHFEHDTITEAALWVLLVILEFAYRYLGDTYRDRSAAEIAVP